MGFIYKITNKVNGKCYIGKTEKSVEQRFKEHISDSKKERCKNRPLYRAMNKYGVDNFTIELIESCDNTTEQEIYWIGFYKSYGNSGYNATKGGDGKKFIDYETVLEFYSVNYRTKTVLEIAKLFDIDHSGLCRFLTSQGFDLTKNKINRSPTKRKVLLVEYNMIFESLSDAARFVESEGGVKSPIKNIVEKISLVCRGKTKTAFKYKWMFV